MKVFRFVIQRATVERCEVEVSAPDFDQAATIAGAYPLGSSDWRRRRVRIVREFGEVPASSEAHEVISGREVR